MQNSRGLSPGTGNSSEDNIGDWSELKKTERPVTVIGARRSARTAAEVEMSFMIAGASGLLWQTAGWPWGCWWRDDNYERGFRFKDPKDKKTSGVSRVK